MERVGGASAGARMSPSGRQPVEADPDPQAGPAAIVHLQVVPGAATEGLAGRHGDAFKVRVRAPPEGGAANRAVLALLAERLGVRPGALVLLSGAAQARKRVRVRGLDAATVARRLETEAP